MYYWTKYRLKSLTQILSKKILNFGPGPNGDVIVERQWNINQRHESPMYKYSKDVLYPFEMAYSCIRFTTGQKYSKKGSRFTAQLMDDKSLEDCNPPYSDYEHFSGGRAVWFYRPPSNVLAPLTNRLMSGTGHLWWKTLVSLQKEDGINLTTIRTALETNTGEWSVLGL